MNTNTKKNNNKNGSIFTFDQDRPSIIASQDRGCSFTVNITQDFGDANTFDHVIDLLMNATEADDIYFNINSAGGNLFSLVALQNAIYSTRANYHMVLMGEASSAGGALFLTKGASSYAVGDNTMLMIHPVQCGVGYGSATGNLNRADANKKLNDKFIRYTYEGFLTEEEILDVVRNDKEIYLFDDDIRSRIIQREEVIQAENDKRLNEVLEASGDEPQSHIVNLTHD